MKQALWAIGLLLIATSAVWAAADRFHSLRGDVAIEASSNLVEAKLWYDGDGKIMREFVQQPPLVPHDIEDFSINMDGNSCLSCHNWDSEMPGATKVGVSHFLNRNNEALIQISPRRYFCTQCHVPQKNAKPLVLNSFKSLSEE